MKMKKLTDEQLSRVLSEHAAGMLSRLGWDGPCLLHAAYNVSGLTDADADTWHLQYGYWVDWFDERYDRSWTTTEFLRQLEKQGIA